MSTVADLLARTRVHLYGAIRPRRNRLATDISDETTELTFDFDASQITAGSVLSLGDTELVYVWEKNGSAVTVERGYLGTTASAHPDGTVVEVDPRWAGPHILTALRDEINSWAPQLYRVVVETYTLKEGTHTFDATPRFANAIGLIAAYQNDAYGVSFNLPKIKLDRSQPRALYPSGLAVTIYDVPAAGTQRLVWALPIRTTTFELDTELDDLGVEPWMEEIAGLGAAYRLVGPREVSRLDLQGAGQSRTAEEVSPTLHVQTGAYLRRLRDQAFFNAVARLMSDHPVRWRA